MPPPNTFISVSLGISTTLKARGNQVHTPKSGMAPTTTLAASSPAPQRYISIALTPAANLAANVVPRIRIFANLSLSAAFSAQAQQTQTLRAGLVASTSLQAIAWMRSMLRPLPFGGTTTLGIIGGIKHTINYPNLATFGISTTVSSLLGVQRSLTAPPLIGITGLTADPHIVKFIGAEVAAEAYFAGNATVLKYEWEHYGADLLYRQASPLEKSMIDVDAPRQTNIPAEIIIDTWDPYRCPLVLLPYLAWAMGVTFWNDDWSETTKRAWVAIQWEFKSLRGTDPAIYMAVDFAGRDVTPYGYAVRKIITAPQGQYPSPGMTHDELEEWLATLPQVRVYLFQQFGQATTDEFYMNYSYLSP